MNCFLKIHILLILIICTANISWSDEYLVVDVIDGDTIVIQDSGYNRKIDIKKIDVPELGQPFGLAAKELLQGIILNKIVRVEDGYIFAPEKNRQIAWELIENGLAWCDNIKNRNHPIAGC